MCTDVIELPCVEECCPLAQLLRVVAFECRSPSVVTQEIDVSLSGEIKAEAIAADQRACGGGRQVKSTNRAAQNQWSARGRASAHCPPRKAEAGCRHMGWLGKLFTGDFVIMTGDFVIMVRV